MPHREITYQPGEKLAKRAEAYRGKWIVIVRDEILMAGEDPFELQRQADERGIEYDALLQVPEEKEPPVHIL